MTKALLQCNFSGEYYDRKHAKTPIISNRLHCSRDPNSPKIRGVQAEWENEEDRIHLSFYFDGEATEDELEEASITCTEIIAQFSVAHLEEDYIRLDYPEPLPESPFWAYRRLE